MRATKVAMESKANVAYRDGHPDEKGYRARQNVDTGDRLGILDDFRPWALTAA